MLKLYRTGEIHSNGWDVYRRVGDRPKRGAKGLSGVFYAFDDYTMYACDKSYKDINGRFDGEPSYPIYDYEIISHMKSASYPGATKRDIDENLRKKLRKENTDGFLLAEKGDVVGVHLNRNNRPFFNVKYPRDPSKHKGIYPSQTIGHTKAVMLTDCWFYVGNAGIRDVVFKNQDKKPFAGANGYLEAIELGGGQSFGKVPKSAGTALFYNPKDRDIESNTYKMHNFFFVDKDSRPVKEASKVVMREWKVFAESPVYMTDREINKVLKEHGLKRADVQEDLSLFFKGRTASEKLQEIEDRLLAIEEGFVRKASHSENREIYTWLDHKLY